MCIGGGYGEAKYVVEKVFCTFSRGENFQLITICPSFCLLGHGGSNQGYWTPNHQYSDWSNVWRTDGEWRVGLVRLGANTFGKFGAVGLFAGCTWGRQTTVPHSSSLADLLLSWLLKTVSWIPLDIAARTILDVALTPAFASATPHLQTLHIVHPHPVSWSKIFARFSQAMTSSQEQLPLVPFAEWWAKLEKHASESTVPSPLPGEERPPIPAMKLLSFFRDWAERDDARRSEMQSDEQSEVFGQAYLSTKMIREVSVSMKTLVTSGESSMLSEEDVKRWIDFWQNKGLFEIVN